MPPEESPSEQDKEKTNGLEADFVSTPCTEEQYIFKMIGQELREKPDTTDIELPNLFKKYGTYEQYQKAAEKTGNLQSRLLEAFMRDDEAKIAELRTAYETQFPNQIEGVTALFEMRNFLKTKKSKDRLDMKKMALYDEISELKTKKDTAPDDTEIEKQLSEKFAQMREAKDQSFSNIKDIVAYQALLADFIKKNPQKEAFLKEFWSLIRISGGANEQNNKLIEQTIAAVLSQVAITHALEKNGHNPRLVTLEEDAAEKIDLWIGQDAVQIKGTPDELAILDSKDEIDIPGSQIIQENGTVIHVTDYLAREQKLYREKIENYKIKKGIKEMKAFIIAVPHKKMNSITGMPDEDVVKLIGEKIGQGPNIDK